MRGLPWKDMTAGPHEQGTDGPREAQGAEAVVRLLFDRLATGDLDGAALLAHPDLDFVVAPPSAVLPAAFRGREGLREYDAARHAEYERVLRRARSFRDLPDGRVLVLGTLELTSPGEHRGFASAAAWACRVEDGLVREIHPYLDLELARRELGLDAPLTLG
jgi:ketosteroid isomerase-like protein